MRIASPSRGMAITLAAVVLFAVPALAEHTRWWRQNSFEDLEKGVEKGVALRQRRQAVPGAAFHAVSGRQSRLSPRDALRFEGKFVCGGRFK